MGISFVSNFFIINNIHEPCSEVVTDAEKIDTLWWNIKKHIFKVGHVELQRTKHFTSSNLSYLINILCVPCCDVCYDFVTGITIPKGQEKMYHPEKLATYGTQKKKNNTNTYVLDTTICTFTDLLYVSLQVFSIVLCLSL
jgi:hypothetical protein